MKLQQETPAGINVVRALDASGVMINDTRYTTSLILSARSLTEDWPVASVDEFDETACEPIVAHDAEIVLLGTGDAHRHVDTRFLAWFAARGMGLEVMSTNAACRTFNVLAGEERRVVAALILDGDSGSES